MSNPQRPHGLQSTRLLCPWDFPGKSTGVGCHCLLQEKNQNSIELYKSKVEVHIITLCTHPTPALVLFWRKCVCVCVCVCVHACAKSLQSGPTLCDPMDHIQPGSFVHGILQGRILEWVAMPSSRGLPEPGIKSTSLVSLALAGEFLTTSTT